MTTLYYPVIFCNHQKKKKKKRRRRKKRRKNFVSNLVLSFFVPSFDLVLHHLFPGLDHPFLVKNIERLWKRKKERERERERLSEKKKVSGWKSFETEEEL